MSLFLSVLVVAALSHGLSTKHDISRCGNPEPSRELQEVSRLLSVEENRVRDFELYTKDTLNVDVYFHTVSASSDTLLSVSFGFHIGKVNGITADSMRRI